MSKSKRGRGLFDVLHAAALTAAATKGAAAVGVDGEGGGGVNTELRRFVHSHLLPLLLWVQVKACAVAT